MHKFVRSLITEWRKLGLPTTGETIVVAVSGGADSVSLLLAIHDLVRRKKLDLGVLVAHFNHKLRDSESDADEKFVQALSAELGFEFVSGSADLSRKGNLEQEARNARYKFLGEAAHAVGAVAVLTAHTRNDQAETFLLNLIRGSGQDGLAGMRAARNMNNETLLVRPLLSWANRADTEEFCRENKIEFRMDQMNDDERFTRVRIRKTILPALAEINPKIVETLARTSELLRRDGEVNGRRESDSGQNAELQLKDLKSLPKEKLYADLRDWLRSSRGNLRSLEMKHIEAVERLILSRKSGKTIELPDGGRVAKQGGRLVFSNIKVEK